MSILVKASTRSCKACGESKPLTKEFFSMQSGSKTNFLYKCKACSSAQMQAAQARYREKHREVLLERRRAYRKEHADRLNQRKRELRAANPERRRAQERAAYAADPQRFRDTGKRHYARNREELLLRRREHPDYQKRSQAYNLKWRTTHREQYRAIHRARAKKMPEYYAAKTRNRRAKLKAAEGTHTAQDVRLQLDRQERRCWWCGDLLTRFHADHLIPLARGGTNGPENIVCSCPTCNLTRSSKLPHEWSDRLL